MRTRSLTPEIMDAPHHPPGTLEQFHRDLRRINLLLGNRNAIVERLRGSEARSVLDIGCGDGALLEHIRAKTGITDVCGVDVQPCSRRGSTIPIIQADATRDHLPSVDVAVCVLTLHHLTDEQVIALVRNVGLSAKRFICLELVRHPLPLLLFNAFVAPLVHRIAAVDGRQSIRRAYRPEELRKLVSEALVGQSATVEHWVSPIYAKQIVDIRFRRELH